MQQQVRSCWTQSYDHTASALNCDDAAFQPAYLLKSPSAEHIVKAFYSNSALRHPKDLQKELTDKPGLYPFYRNYVKEKL